MENIKYSENLVIGNFDGKILLKDKQISCDIIEDVYDDQENWIDGEMFCIDNYEANIDNVKTLRLIESMRMRRKYKMPLL